jgi:hypothetical protein
MQFQITDIEFDFDLGCDVDVDVDDYIGTFWEANDGDDLIEEITAAAGWSIKTIDYRHILK